MLEIVCVFMYWDKTNGLTTRAVELNTLARCSSKAPTIATQVLDFG